VTFKRATKSQLCRPPPMRRHRRLRLHHESSDHVDRSQIVAFFLSYILQCLSLRSSLELEVYSSRILLLSSLTFIACPNDVRGRRPWVLHSHGLTWFAFSLYSGKSDPFGDSPHSSAVLRRTYSCALRNYCRPYSRNWLGPGK
jgi:hypothetical protein